ncbi:PTS system galactose-specific transporter subunit IIB [Streptococcus pneumoniae]|nr:PTS system galactose-specific transporter subunit IIB [Streptococcus pneumoniae]
MIKILAACGAGVNSSHQIKSALEEELSNRGYDVHCDAVLTSSVLSTTSKLCFEQPAASFLVYSLIFIEY